MPDCSQADRSGDGTVAPARPTVAGIFRRHAGDYVPARPLLSPEQRRLIHDIEVCRTAALGGHLYVCDACGHEVPVYNSCRNRGCPQCQALDQDRWIEAEKARVLPVGHHHVVFTLPAELRPLARRCPRAVFGLLFDAVRDTLTVLPQEHLGLHLGVTAVLHTWTREMLFHPHVHGVVTAGGLTLDGRWVDRKGFLLPVALMKAFFRSRILHFLDRLRAQGALSLPGEDGAPDTGAWDRLIRSLPPPEKWCIHIEPPFGRSAHVIEYLGRYTHRIALSDFRLVSVSDDQIRFRTRGDATTTLSPFEFLDRFLLHVLPPGLHKIRHFGLYAAANARGRRTTARTLLGEGDRGTHAEAPPPPPEETAVEQLHRLTGEDKLRCPTCPAGRMVRHALPDRVSRAPPGGSL